MTDRELTQRITDYLTGGGLFNPEMANHEAVRDLLIDCRDALAHPNPAAQHWHDLYKAKCKDLHDRQAMLGAEIVALEEEIEELKEEQPEQEPVAQIRVKNGYWIDTPRSAKVKSLPDGLHDLYTAPIRHEWQELYKDEIKQILNDGEEWSSLEFVQAVSDLLRGKNT